TPSGLTATVSSYRMATLPCCFGQCSISPAQRRSMLITKDSGTCQYLLTIFGTFASSTAKPPGHPEDHWVSGVETTTGPLGQGVATSVGMAIAQKWLAHRYNRPRF